MLGQGQTLLSSRANLGRIRHLFYIRHSALADPGLWTFAVCTSPCSNFRGLSEVSQNVKAQNVRRKQRKLQLWPEVPGSNDRASSVTCTTVHFEEDGAENHVLIVRRINNRARQTSEKPFPMYLPYALLGHDTQMQSMNC